ncbi:MAG: MarR family transcriptional regulator [Bacteroidota bacterium]
MDNKQLIQKRDGSIGYYMGRTHRTMENRINKMFQEAGINLYMEHWIVLMNLWIEDGLSQQEVAERIFKDKASVTRVLSSMEQKNLLIRVPDQKDKRIKRIHLTHLGRNLKETTMPLMDGNMEYALDGISEEEIQTCIKVMDKIFQNINNSEK